MDHTYWIQRKRAAAANASRAVSSRARLVHLDLAGRYSVMAAAAAERPDASYYERLETGARWLASRARIETERQEHLGMAGKYARLRVEAAAEARR